jgi:hypothetical protein
MRDTVHRAPPAISESPLPMNDTSAVSLAVSSAVPDPAMLTAAVRLVRPRALTLPEPATERSARVALPRALRLPEPAMLKFALATRKVATSRLPDPATEAANRSPSA